MNNQDFCTNYEKGTAYFIEVSKKSCSNNSAISHEISNRILKMKQRSQTDLIITQIGYQSNIHPIPSENTSQVCLASYSLNKKIPYLLLLK